MVFDTRSSLAWPGKENLEATEYVVPLTSKQVGQLDKIVV